jgi:hypothetical protein
MIRSELFSCQWSYSDDTKIHPTSHDTSIVALSGFLSLVSTPTCSWGARLCCEFYSMLKKTCLVALEDWKLWDLFRKSRRWSYMFDDTSSFHWVVSLFWEVVKKPDVSMLICYIFKPIHATVIICWMHLDWFSRCGTSKGISRRIHNSLFF